MRYPQYKISQWIETSEEALNQPEATISYGVQIKTEKGAWWELYKRGNKPLLFDSLKKADEAIGKLKVGIFSCDA